MSKQPNHMANPEVSIHILQHDRSDNAYCGRSIKRISKWIVRSDYVPLDDYCGWCERAYWVERTH